MLLAGVEKKIWQTIVAVFVCDCTSGHSVQTDEPPTVWVSAFSLKLNCRRKLCSRHSLWHRCLRAFGSSQCTGLTEIKKHEQCPVRPSVSHLLLVDTPRSSKQRPGKEFLITQASAVTRTLQGSESTRPYSYKLIKCRNPLGRAQLLYS